MKSRIVRHGVRAGLGTALSLAALAGAGRSQGLEKQLITPTIGTSTQRFGNGIAAQDGVLVVGAPFEDTKASNAGAAYVYRYDALTEAWLLEQQIFPSDPEVSANFGAATCISGDVLAVGANMEDNTKGTDAGAVYVFRYNASTKIWTEEQKLVASVGAATDHFGAALALSGTVLIVGAPESDASAGNECGSAYVYRYQNSFVKWVEEARLLDPDGTKSDAAGFAVDLAGTVAVVGSPLSDDNALKDSGSVGIWEYSAGAWTQVAELVQGTPDDDSNFGTAVALDDDLIAVGARGEDFSSTVTDSGGAYVFRKTAGVWSQEAHFTPPAPVKSAEFGNAVDAKGKLVIVGTWKDDSSGKTDAGSNWTYRRGRKAWFLDQQLGASDAGTTDNLGGRVALTTSHILSAADLNDTALGTDSGAVYVYPAAEITTEITPTAPPPSTIVKFSSFYGSPGDPCMVTMEDIGGVPVFIPLLTFLFSTDRTLTFSVPSPDVSYGITVGFRSYKISETGPVVFSELEYLDI